MNIQELERLYVQLPQVSALAKLLGKSSEKKIFLKGLLGSSAPMLFASLARKSQSQLLFVLQDAEEAGYFYHDLTQLMGTDQVLFFLIRTRGIEAETRRTNPYPGERPDHRRL